MRGIGTRADGNEGAVRGQRGGLLDENGRDGDGKWARWRWKVGHLVICHLSGKVLGLKSGDAAT